MDQEDFSSIVCDGIVVPAAALRRQNRNDRYGHVEGLPDEGLAGPEELERMENKEMWGPILRLPQQRWECSIRPNMDEDGKINWGAFGTVDFDSYRPQKDKLRYLIGKLWEEVKDQLILFRLVKEKIPGPAKYKILRLVRDGVIDTDDIELGDTWLLAQIFLRIWRLRKRIEELKAKTEKEQEKAAQEFEDSIGKMVQVDIVKPA